MPDIAMEKHRDRMKQVYRLKSRREFFQNRPSMVGIVLSIAAVAAPVMHIINAFDL